jgi:hypothetical protein
MELDQELQTHHRELPRLLREGHEGEYALIYRDRVDSFWPTDRAAYEAGCTRFGVDPFLVKQVLRTEPVLCSTVDVIR